MHDNDSHDHGSDAPGEHDVRLLFPAYAAGTATSDEMRRVDEAVAHDAAARAELDDHIAIMAGIGAASPQVEPPAELRASIVGAVAAANAHAGPGLDPKPTLHEQQRRWWNAGWAVGAIGVAAAASLAAVAWLGIENASLRTDLDETRGIVAQVAGPTESAMPGMEMAEFETMGGFENVSNMAVMIDGHAMLALQDVPDPPRGHHYQAWTKDTAGEMSRPAKAMEGGTVIYLDLGDMHGATDVTEIMITIEKNGATPDEPGEMVLHGSMA